ncbi:MAG: Zn-dependent hydrolase of the beta-lactamase fold-like protein, partial [uncultured bacterium]
MEITYLGHASFRIKGKTAVVVTDPFDPVMLGMKFPHVDADIVTVSHNHADHNMANLVAAPVGGSKKVITGPGEYEIKGVSVLGFPTFHDDKNGELRGKNTVYVIYLDGYALCHLGDLGHTLSEETINQIGDVDILFVPVGGFFTLDVEKAIEVVHSIEPKVIIPMHFKVAGLSADLASKLASV